MNTKRTYTTLKTPLLNDCTNHLSFRLKQSLTKDKPQSKNVSRSYESPLTDIVTSEFVRGYN